MTELGYSPAVARRCSRCSTRQSPRRWLGACRFEDEDEQALTEPSASSLNHGRLK